MKSCVLAMPVLKRPSLNSSAMPKKKPAKETIPGTVACLRKGIQNDDDNADADGDEGQRDKLKAEKWARLRATGALPEYLLQLYDQEVKAITDGEAGISNHNHKQTLQEGQRGLAVGHVGRPIQGLQSSLRAPLLERGERSDAKIVDCGPLLPGG